MSMHRQIKRSVVEQTVRQLVDVVTGLQTEVKNLHLRMLFTERVVKEKIGLEQAEIDPIIEGLIKERDAQVEAQSAEAAVVGKEFVEKETVSVG